MQFNQINKYSGQARHFYLNHFFQFVQVGGFVLICSLISIKLSCSTWLSCHYDLIFGLCSEATSNFFDCSSLQGARYTENTVDKFMAVGYSGIFYHASN